ncbi:uncharacterized protein LOC105022764 isoform X2 [Esox lucius]|uniref:uncharacterized protein LOC105022764 isoform X2 n=1 Tax=Esox lucius TaxID=8010 RepID=UPI0014773A3A|nr:uncharacterized protein LOC105022764 isoform X2 [Esox lucius]
METNGLVSVKGRGSGCVCVVCVCVSPHRPTQSVWWPDGFIGHMCRVARRLGFWLGPVRLPAVLGLGRRTRDSCSVVKVAGSNISHKLRLSSVKPSDEGTYECRVIDFSDADRNARHHKVRAYLQVEQEANQNPPRRRHGDNFEPEGIKGLAGSTNQQEHGHHSHHKPPAAGRELRKRSAEADSTTDCTDSCPLDSSAHP